MLSAAGCAPPPRGDRVLLENAGGEGALIAGDPFRHFVFRRWRWDGSRSIHVYLEGDGLPWLTRTRIARDPSPRSPLALRLMARDPTPSLYLGRPCYHGLAHSPGCSPRLWTHGRYSEAVVKSMTAALRRALGPDAKRELTLIGYSGGGVLAMLIAPRIEQVRGVVTVAANLDIDAWADHHGYSRLSDSLNPAKRPPLPTAIRQVHLAGGRDVRVPPHLSRPVAARQPGAKYLLLGDFDHTCCWERAWPSILASLTGPDQAAAAGPGPLAHPFAAAPEKD